MQVDSAVIDKVAQLAMDSKKSYLEVVKLECVEPSGDYLLRDHARGTSERFTPGPAPRKYGAHRLADIAGIVRHFAGVGAPAELPPADGDEPAGPAAANPYLPIFVWVNPQAVTVVLGESGRRRERVTLGLSFTDQFKLLSSWDADAGKAWLQHPDFIHALRVALNAVYEPANLIDIMRNLKFKASEQGGSSVVAGGGSLGRAVEARAMGIDENGLIEDVVVSVPVYEQLTLANEVDLVKYPVRCSLDVDPQNRRMRLVPKAGEIELVVRQAQSAIVETLRRDVGSIEGVKVFRGDAG